MRIMNVMNVEKGIKKVQLERVKLSESVRLY